MKKRIIAIVSTIMFVMFLSGCEQYATKHLGGNMTVHLESNTKLVNVTWKDNNLWFLVKPMTDNDIAETYYFQEDSELGILEGTVTIIETKTDVNNQ